MSPIRSFLATHRTDVIIVTILTILIFAVRLPIASERKIMPAGDAFNFQHIASYIQYGEYPSKEKRLPVYPIFILLGRTLGFDPIRTSIGISIIASTGTILALYGLGRVFQFNRGALIAFLGLAMFDPLLIINGVRPLSDGLFVFFVAMVFYLTALLLKYPQTATRSMRILYSITITLLMFTRYEGFLIAGLTAPFLFIKLPWKKVILMASLPIITILLWIPAYKSIHGSITKLSYVTDATNTNGGFGEIRLIPENFDRLMSGAGWKRVWSHPDETTALSLLASSSWWVGVLSILGLLYIMFRGGYAGVTIILAGAGYALLLSWWWVYSRYVAPLSILFYFGAAGGMTVIVHTTELLLRRINIRTFFIASLVPLLTIPILLNNTSPLHKLALNRAWESNRKGYALYEAMINTAKQDGLIVYATREHANATLFFGVADEKKSRKNPGKGVYLSDIPTTNIDTLYTKIAHYKPHFLIETDYDTRMPKLITLLEEHSNVKNKQAYKEVRWDTLELESTNVYELTWP